MLVQSPLPQTDTGLWTGCYQCKVLVTHLGDELDPYEPDFLFRVVVLAQLLQGVIHILGFCLLEVVEHFVDTLLIHDLDKEVVDVDLCARVDDGLDLVQQLVEVQTFRLGDVVQGNLSVNRLDDRDL